MPKKAEQSLKKQFLQFSETSYDLAKYAGDMAIQIGNLTEMRKVFKSLQTNFEDILLLSEGANSNGSKIPKVDVAMSCMVAKRTNLINKQVTARAQRNAKPVSEEVRKKTGSQVDRECAEHDRRVEDKRRRSVEESRNSRAVGRSKDEPNMRDQSTKCYRHDDGPKALLDEEKEEEVAKKTNFINKQVTARAQRNAKPVSDEVRKKTVLRVDRECAEHDRRVEDKRRRSTKRYRNDNGPQANSEREKEDEAAVEGVDVRKRKKKRSCPELPAVDLPEVMSAVEVNQEGIETNADSEASQIIASLNVLSEAWGRNLLIIGSCDGEPVENNPAPREDEAASENAVDRQTQKKKRSKQVSRGSSSKLPAVDLPESTSDVGVNQEDTETNAEVPELNASLDMSPQGYGSNLLIMGSCDGERVENNSADVFNNINSSSCAESHMPRHVPSIIFPPLPFTNWYCATVPEKYLAEEILFDLYHPKKVVAKPAEPPLIDLVTPEKVAAKPAEPLLIDSPEKVVANRCCVDVGVQKKLPVRGRLYFNPTEIRSKKKKDDSIA